MKSTISLLLVLTVLINGCGEFTYKRGTTPRDLEQARKSCEAAARNVQAGHQAAAECLEKQGWTVVDMDDSDLFATASYSGSNPSQTIDKATDKPIDKPHRYAAENVTMADTAEANENVATAETKASESEKRKAKPPAPDPLDIYIINSWWKMGGSGQKMGSDIDACVATLGEAHRPNQKTQEVTRGLILCMREKGWRPLKSR